MRPARLIPGWQEDVSPPGRDEAVRNEARRAARWGH